MALVLVFAFCQALGMMCAVPDLAVAEEGFYITEDVDPMFCPMEATGICPPSVTSSPERQVKNGAAIEHDRGPILLSSAVVFTAPSIRTQWSKSSACSIAPISTDSSSPLRI